MTEPALQPSPPAATLPGDPAVAGAAVSDLAADSAERRLADAVAAFADRLDEGGDPDPAEFLGADPEMSKHIAECLAGLAAMAELRRSLPADPWAPAGFEAGEVVGDYELVGELGRGGMGVVYKARQISLGRTVALKMILSGRHASDEDLRRFRAEAEAAAGLRHPGIVPIYEVGELEGRPYFTMEYVPGRSLAERLAEGPLPVRQAAELVAAVADAVEHAHRNGVLHRDLKPGNILLAVESEKRKVDGAAADPVSDVQTAPSAFHSSLSTPRLTDFGLAKRLDADAGLTATGDVVGSPNYMAPEQALGRADLIGPATDVHALGVLLYCCLTGTRPFRGSTVPETLAQVITADPVPPERLNRHVATDLSLICGKCLEKEPRRRYPSAQAVAEDLRAFLEGRPVTARPVTLLSRLGQAVGREPHPEIIVARSPLAAIRAFAGVALCGVITALRFVEGAEDVIHGLLIAGGFFVVHWRAPIAGDPVIERHVHAAWRAFLTGCLAALGLNFLMGLPPLTLSPMVGVMGGMTMMVNAHLLSGWFYLGAVGCFAAAAVMPFVGRYDFLVLGGVFCLSLLVPAARHFRAR